MVPRLNQIDHTDSNTFKYVRLLAHENPGISILDFDVGGGAAASLISRHTLGIREESTTMLRYLFASPTEADSKHAEERLNHLSSFLEFKAVSLSKSPTSQGLQTGSFDIILLSLLGGDHDLDKSLVHAKTLLKPRGKLCIVGFVNPGISLSLVSRSLEGLQR